VAAGVRLTARRRRRRGDDEREVMNRTKKMVRIRRVASTTPISSSPSVVYRQSVAGCISDISSPFGSVAAAAASGSAFTGGAAG
jgi:hypothetical protein